MLKFSKQDDVRLIKMVADNSFLWNTGDAKFKNLYKKELTWKQIAVALKKTDVQCKHRWKHIRDHYRRRRKFEKNAEPGKAVTKKRATYWDGLRFLDGLEDERTLEGEDNQDTSTADGGIRTEDNLWVASPSERKIMATMLEMYKAHKFLWDPLHSLYYNKEVRNQGLNNLLTVYRQLHPDATIKSLKKKLENMRNTFNKECKKIEESMSTTQDASKVYVPKLWYFEHMKFLAGKIFSKSGSDALDDSRNTDLMCEVVVTQYNCFDGYFIKVFKLRGPSRPRRTDMFRATTATTTLEVLSENARERLFEETMGFPIDPEERKKWTNAMRREKWEPSKYSRICSKHFKPEDFDRSPFYTKLKKGVVPSVFDVFPHHFDHIKHEQSTQEPDVLSTDESLPPPPKKVKPSGKKTAEELLGMAAEYFNSPETEWDVVARGWALKLSRLAPDQRLFAEKIINDTLFEAQLGTLTKNGVRFLNAWQSNKHDPSSQC